MAMTVLAAIIVIAVTILVYNATHQNKFWTMMFVWLVLALIFTGMIFIVHEHLQDDTTTTRQALGPLWDMVCTEYQNFKQDWREQIMLLKNVAENPFPDDESSLTPAVAMDSSNRGDAKTAAALTSSSSSF
jgi:Na+/melibiose symporter-like transporter